MPKIDLWGNYGEHQLVGVGAVTNPENAEKTNPKACGRFYGFNGCVHTELHDVTTFDAKGNAVNHKGKAYISKRFRYCNRPTCPICYRHWAWRESLRVETLIKEAEKKQGKAQHIITSVPSSDYDLKFEGLHKKAVNTLYVRGIKGGCLIFHAFRFRRKSIVENGVRIPKGRPYWSPHWHTLGFLANGYGKCRHCPNNRDGQGWIKETAKCLTCDGFEGRTRREYAKDGYIVKVKEERKTIQGTAWYQLNHCSIRPDKRGSHAVTWFGTCSRKKLVLTKAVMKELRETRKCPICGMELVELRHMGFEGARIASEFWIKDWEEDAFDKDGLPVWVEKT